MSDDAARERASEAMMESELRLWNAANRDHGGINGPHREGFELGWELGERFGYAVGSAATLARVVARARSQRNSNPVKEEAYHEIADLLEADAEWADRLERGALDEVKHE